MPATAVDHAAVLDIKRLEQLSSQKFFKVLGGTEPYTCQTRVWHRELAEGY